MPGIGATLFAAAGLVPSATPPHSRRAVATVAPRRPRDGGRLPCPPISRGSPGGQLKPPPPRRPPLSSARAPSESVPASQLCSGRGKTQPRGQGHTLPRAEAHAVAGSPSVPVLLTSLWGRGRRPPSPVRGGRPGAVRERGPGGEGPSPLPAPKPSTSAPQKA